MRHPALTRIFSIILTILCFVMAAAGGVGLSGAKEDSQDRQAEVDRLQKRMEEYDTVTQALAGKISYAEAKEALDEEQEQHDSDAAQHRTDLAIHTATKSGLNQGEEALQEAQLTLVDARKQYKEGLYEYKQQKEAFYNDVYNPYMETKEELTNALEIFNNVPGMIFGLNPEELTWDIEPSSEPDSETGDGEDEKDTGDDTGGSGETGGGNTEGDGSTEGDSNTKGDGGTEGGDGPTDPPPEGNPSSELPSGDAPDPGTEAPGPVAAAAFGNRRPRLVLLSAGGSDKSYQKADILGAYAALTGACGQMQQAAAGLSGALSGLSDLSQLAGSGTLPEGQVEMFQMLPTLAGSLSDIGAYADSLAAQLQSSSDRISGMGDTISVEDGNGLAAEYNTFWKNYSTIYGQFSLIVNNLPLKSLASALEGIKSGMEAQEPELLQGKAMIDAAGEQLDQAKHALDKGDLELFNTLATIKYQKSQLEEEAEEMREEKERLDQEALDLAEKEEQAQQQRELEKRQTSLRVILMDNEGIAQRVDGGMELIESAQEYSRELTESSQREYQNRFAACILMILGGLAGFTGIPAAFEKLKNRAALILPVVVCLLCSVAAEAVMESVGQGRAYAAIFTGLFALIQLLIVLPKAKKPGQTA